MKKLFTLMVMCVMAVAAKADITIYVKAVKAPYLYVWAGADNGAWPGTQMTETADVKGETFWKKTFVGATALNAIFNDGAGNQTTDITGLTSDRYFTYDGAKTYEDITENYAVIPDAVISSLLVAGDFNQWSLETAVPFTEVEKGKVFAGTLDFSAVTTEAVLFKFVVNAGMAWVGYSQITLDAPEGWVAEGIENSNFEIEFAKAGGNKVFDVTATWAGGKKAEEGWSVKIAAHDPAGISSVKANATTAIPFNLAGQRVANGYKGLVIKNGQKVMVK